jgi:tetratricopeptide (TPR) repeat protein
MALNGNLFAQSVQVYAIDEKYEHFEPCIGEVLTQADRVKAVNGQLEEVKFLKNNVKKCGESSTLTRRLALRLLELGDTNYDDQGVELEQDKREIFDEALDWSRVALSQDTTEHLNYEQMSMAFAAIISVSRLKGKAVLADSVRIYAEEAVRINPKNDRAYHILGRWHFEVSQLSWFLRKLSKIVFRTSPEGSFNLAINYFNKALELDNIPVHRYWLGMAYLKSGNKEEALLHFRQVLELENVQHNDDYFKREAQRLIEEHG